MRTARKIFAKVLPEWIKAHVRSRLFGFYKPETAFNLTFTETDGGLIAHIDGIDLRITLDSKENLIYALMENGSSVEEMKGFLKVGKSKRLLFDVGCHKGLFSLLFCLLGDDKRALAYDPSAVVLKEAAALAQMNNLSNRIEWERKAIGDTPGEGSFDLGGAGFAVVSDSATGSFNSEIVTIDQECARLGEFPDVLKIDIEGYELEALRGAKNLLEKNKPLVFMELHLDLLEKRSISPKTIIEYLISHKYSFLSSSGKPLSASSISNSAQAMYRFIAQ